MDAILIRTKRIKTGRKKGGPSGRTKETPTHSLPPHPGEMEGGGDQASPSWSSNHHQKTQRESVLFEYRRR